MSESSAGGRADPPVRRVRWKDARRIISTRHPPVDLFEDIADPSDWDLIAAEEAKTNPRLMEQIGRLALVPPERRVSGPGTSYLMAPFVHISPAYAGRFDDGTFGALYVAKSIETAIAETSHHRGKFYRASKQKPGWFSQFRELIIPIDHRFHDLRGEAGFAGALNPDDYTVSQALAQRLRSAGSDGILFPSVRDTDGQCIAAFWPDVVGLPTPGRAFAYHFDGSIIDLVRDETSRDVWRLDRTG